MSYLLKVFYSMLYIEEIVKYITSRSNCSKWRKLRCLIREEKKKQKKGFYLIFFHTYTIGI